MINSAILHLTNYLNQYLKRTFDLNEDIVALSNIVEQDGTVATNVTNKLVVCLVNIEKDSTSVNLPKRGMMPSDKAVMGYPPVHLNLYLMFAAHFSGNNYSEALKFLSHTISFFQRNPVFDHQNTPDLDRRIHQLALDIENLDTKDLSSLWSILSGKYLPSILYKVRMLSFAADDIKAQIPVSKAPQPSVVH
jgi:hypothetical protein